MKQLNFGRWTKDGKRYRIPRAERPQAILDGFVNDPLPALEEAQLRAIYRMRNTARELLKGEFTLGAYTLTADAETLAVLMSAKIEADVDPAYILDDFELPDGSLRDLNATQIGAVYNALQAHRKSVRNRGAQVRQEILASTTVEEVKAVTW